MYIYWLNNSLTINLTYENKPSTRRMWKYFDLGSRELELGIETNN